jgi:hypothetical protein
MTEGCACGGDIRKHQKGDNNMTEDEKLRTEFWAKRREHDRNIPPARRAAIDAYEAEAKAEAARIDPDTAEVTWWYADYGDPYRLYGYPPDLIACVGREHFVRNSGSEIWVWEGDLPQKTLKKVRERFKPSITVTRDDVVWNV